MNVFTLEISVRTVEHGYQERAIITGALQQVARAVGAGTEESGSIMYGDAEIGKWSLGKDSHVHRERVDGNGPGTWAALPDEEKARRHGRARA